MKTTPLAALPPSSGAKLNSVKPSGSKELSSAKPAGVPGGLTLNQPPPSHLPTRAENSYYAKGETVYPLSASEFDSDSASMADTCSFCGALLFYMAITSPNREEMACKYGVFMITIFRSCFKLRYVIINF